MTFFILVGLVLQQPPVTFKAGTRMVTVPVVVRDRDGNAVGDLQQQAFELMDNGKRRDITSFSIESTSKNAQPGVPERFLAYVIDDLSLETSEQQRLRDAGIRQLKGLKPGDRMGIFSTSCRLWQDFTDDRVKLEEVLNQMQARSSPVCRVARTETIPIASMRAIVKRMAALPGQRSIILVTSGIVLRSDFRDREDGNLVDEAVEAKVLINVLRVAGLSTQAIAPVDMGGGVHGGLPASGSTQAVAGSGIAVLETLSGGTGGRLVESGNDLDAGFRSMATPEYIYVLAFASEDVKPDGQRQGQAQTQFADAKRLLCAEAVGWRWRSAQPSCSPSRRRASPSNRTSNW